MRAHRYNCIAIPLGTIEQSHSVEQRIATIADLPVDVRADYSALDRPTVLRRAETPPGWSELSREERAEHREYMIERLSKRLADARGELSTALLQERPTLHLIDRVVRLERRVEMVGRWV